MNTEEYSLDYFKTLGYNLGLMNARIGLDKDVNEIAANFFTPYLEWNDKTDKKIASKIAAFQIFYNTGQGDYEEGRATCL